MKYLLVLMFAIGMIFATSSASAQVDPCDEIANACVYRGPPNGQPFNTDTPLQFIAGCQAKGAHTMPADPLLGRACIQQPLGKGGIVSRWRCCF